MRDNFECKNEPKKRGQRRKINILKNKKKKNYHENTSTSDNYVSFVNIRLNKHCVLDQQLKDIDDYTKISKMTNRNNIILVKVCHQQDIKQDLQ